MATAARIRIPGQYNGHETGGFLLSGESAQNQLVDAFGDAVLSHVHNTNQSGRLVLLGSDPAYFEMGRDAYDLSGKLGYIACPPYWDSTNDVYKQAFMLTAYIPDWETWSFLWPTGVEFSYTSPSDIDSLDIRFTLIRDAYAARNVIIHSMYLGCSNPLLITV